MAPKYTNEQIVSALNQTNGMVYIAARRLGCSPQTIYTRADKNKSIRQAIEDARGEVIDAAELKLKQAVMNGEAWAVAFTLKTIGRNRGYVERQEMTGADGGPVITKVEIVKMVEDAGDGE